MTQKSQTAVEWLIEQLENKIGKSITSVMDHEIKQAKAIHKQEILDAYFYGSQDAGLIKRHQEQYYNETFKQD